MTTNVSPATDDVRFVERFDDLARAKNLLLTTFRRDGTPVSTPVWFVIDDRRLVATTLDGSGKAKRIRNDDRVTVAACTVRGKPSGPTFAARARLLTPHETRAAVKAIDRRYRLGRLMHALDCVMHRDHFVAIGIEPPGARK
jgi:hypothetical protein